MPATVVILWALEGIEYRPGNGPERGQKMVDEIKEVELIPHPDGENYPNDEWLMITTKPSKNSSVKYEVFIRKPQVDESILAQDYGYGLTIGDLLNAGMRNVSYRAPFNGVFSGVDDPESLTDDDHRKLQACLDNYKAGRKGVTKAEKEKAIIQSAKEKLLQELGIDEAKFEKMKAKAQNKK